MTKFIRTLAWPFLFFVLWVLYYLRSNSKPSETNVTVSALKRAARLSNVASQRRSGLLIMKVSAYQAAMLCLGHNVDEFEIVERGSEVQDGDHFFRNTIFKNFVGDLFVLEEIRDDDGNLVRPWEAENDCGAVKQIVYHEDNKDLIKYVELEDEEPLQ